MIRSFIALSLSAVFTLSLSALSLQAAGGVPADKIFPNSTKGFVSIRSLEELTTQWQKTELGQLMNDPLMADFQKTLQQQFTSRLEKTFGLTLDAVTGLPSGEVACGMIAVPNQIPGNVLTMDVADRRQQVDEYLAALTEKLIGIGVKQSTEEYKGQKITVLQFPPPKVNEAEKSVTEKAGTEKAKSTPAEKAKPVDRFAYYLFKGDTLVVSDRLYLIKLIADRIVDQTGSGSLADVEDYQIVMKRLQNDMPQGAAEPQIRWYIEPLNYGESLRTLYAKVDPNKKEKPSIFTTLKQQGFDAIRGIGGYVNLKSEDKESVYRTFIYTKKPFAKAMKMFEFPDGKSFSPPSWMPADLARCTLVYVDPLKIFDNFGTLFDAVAMQGEQGVWKDIIKGLEEDPAGPKINLRNELITQLGTRVLGMSHYAKPITVNSESIVVAIELKDGNEKPMIAALEKLFGTDPEMQGTPHKNYKLWRRIQGEAVIMPVEIEVPSLVDAAPTTAKKTAPPKDELENPPLVFPDGALVVAKGCLFVSTNIDYLITILDRLDAESEAVKSMIREQADYKEIDRIFAGMGLTDKPHFLQLFARTHETFRPTYEMIRQNRMPQSQALLGKVMNFILEPDGEEGSRKQTLDGSALPVFDKVEKYFGSVGVYGMSEDSGFFIKGFLLQRAGK
ncbi:MAG: DUF3352 domain-containing protein [Planctomycetaceae bacterium]|nr:DUF3352 domain-containing protein [Planctomycetaceae bacterium]